jgi:hypothetical protein
MRASCSVVQVQSSSDFSVPLPLPAASDFGSSASLGTSSTFLEASSAFLSSAFPLFGFLSSDFGGSAAF